MSDKDVIDIIFLQIEKTNENDDSFRKDVRNTKWTYTLMKRSYEKKTCEKSTNSILKKI